MALPPDLNHPDQAMKHLYLPHEPAVVNSRNQSPLIMMTNSMQRMPNQMPSPAASLAVGSGGAPLLGNSVGSLQAPTSGVYPRQFNPSATQHIPKQAHPKIGSGFNAGGEAQVQVFGTNIQASHNFQSPNQFPAQRGRGPFPESSITANDLQLSQTTVNSLSMVTVSKDTGAPATLEESTRRSLPERLLELDYRHTSVAIMHAEPVSDEQDCHVRVTKYLMSVPLELWRMILQHVDPKSMKLIYHIFQDECRDKSVWLPLLTDQTFLDQYRKHQFGKDIPPAPLGMDHWTYLDLLVGRGCQGRCGNPLISRTYWIFMRRWCLDCYKEETITVWEVMSQLRNGGMDEKRLLDCITYDAFNTIIDYKYNWKNHTGDLPCRSYRKRDVKKFIDTYNDGVSLQSESYREAWIQESADAVKAHLNAAKNIWQWKEGRGLDTRLSNIAIRRSKTAFYQAKAMALSPPISATVLDKCPSYYRAIRTSTPHSERTWNILRQKLINDVKHIEAEERGAQETEVESRVAKRARLG